MNGLNRFDGVLFKNYYHDYKDSSSLPGKRINSIVEDSLHNIWIGTNKGMSRYDYKNDRFSNFYRSLSDSGIHDQIVPFWSTPDKVLCFEGNSHITSYDVRTFRKTKLVAITDTGHIIGMGASDQYPVYDLKTQKVWFILGNRFLPGGGLRCVDITNGKTKDYGWECTRHIKNHCHDAEAMRYDSRRNSIWLNTNDGLVEFSLDELRFHPVKAFAKWTALSDYTRFCGISIDTSGRIWVATFPKGIFIYDPRNGMLTRPFENDSVLQKEVSYWNAVLYCDNQGITWSGGWLRKGFYQITPFSQAIRRYTADPLKPHSLNTNSVKSFIKGPGGKLWMGTNRGINIFDPHSDEFSQLKLENVMGLGNNIIPTWIDTVNRYAILFTAPPVGIYRMNLDTRKISTVHFVNTEGLPLSNVEPRLPRHYKRGSILAADLPDRQSVFFLDEQHDTANEILHFAPGTIDESRPLVENDEWLFLRRPEAPTNLSYREINGRWTLSPTALDSVPWSIIIYNERDNSYWAGGNGLPPPL